MVAATAIKHKGPARGASADAALDQIWSANNDYFDTLSRANQAWLFGLAKVGQEVLNFTGERFRQRLTMSEELLRCKDLNHALHIQVEHTQSATEDYLAEANKLFDLASRINQDYWSSLQPPEAPRIERHQGNVRSGDPASGARRA